MYHTFTNSLELEEFIDSANVYRKLRLLAAMKFQPFNYFKAKTGSRYINIGYNFVIRLSNHEFTSPYYRSPDINAVNRELTVDDYYYAKDKVEFGEFAFQTDFAECVGLTVPKLKKILPEDCYDEVVLNDYYPNTKRKVILPEPALAHLDQIGHTERRYCSSIYLSKASQQSW